MSERRGKYNARKCEADGYTFDSAAEYRRYNELVLLQRTGALSDLGDALYTQMLQTGNADGWQREYRFHPVRRWRFDIADPVRMVARGESPLDNCPHRNHAGDVIKRYFRHINTCGECYREWGRE